MKLQSLVFTDENPGPVSLAPEEAEKVKQGKGLFVMVHDTDGKMHVLRDAKPKGAK